MIPPAVQGERDVGPTGWRKSATITVSVALIVGGAALMALSTGGRDAPRPFVALLGLIVVLHVSLHTAFRERADQDRKRLLWGILAVLTAGGAILLVSALPGEIPDILTLATAGVSLALEVRAQGEARRGTKPEDGPDLWNALLAAILIVPIFAWSAFVGLAPLEGTLGRLPAWITMGTLLVVAVALVLFAARPHRQEDA